MIVVALSAVLLSGTPGAADAVRSARLLAQADEAAPQEHPKTFEEPVPNGFARIHLLSDDDDVRLYKQSAKRDDRVPAPFGQILLKDDQVCQAPCGIVVDIRPGQDMYLGGPGMPSTPKFNLLGRQGDVVIDVHGGSYGELFLGYVGSWGGLIVGIAGVGSLIAGLVLNGSTVPFVRSAGSVLTVGGGVGIGLGIAFGLTGLYLVHDGQTRYEVLPSGTRPPSDLPSTLQF